MTTITIVLASVILLLLVGVVILAVKGRREIKQINKQLEGIKNYTGCSDEWMSKIGIATSLDSRISIMSDEIYDSINNLDNRVFDCNRKDSLWSIMEDRINNTQQYMEHGFRDNIISEMDRRLDKVHSKIKGIKENSSQDSDKFYIEPEFKVELKKYINELDIPSLDSQISKSDVIRRLQEIYEDK